MGYFEQLASLLVPGARAFTPTMLSTVEHELQDQAVPRARARRRVRRRDGVLRRKGPARASRHTDHGDGVRDGERALASISRGRRPPFEARRRPLTVMSWSMRSTLPGAGGTGSTWPVGLCQVGLGVSGIVWAAAAAAAA